MPSSWRRSTKPFLSLHCPSQGPQAGRPRWVFKSLVGNAGDIGGVSIYKGSNQRLVAREAACPSTILMRVLTTIPRSALQSQFLADRSVHVHDTKCEKTLNELCRPQTEINM